MKRLIELSYFQILFRGAQICISRYISIKDFTMTTSEIFRKRVSVFAENAYSLNKILLLARLVYSAYYFLDI